MYSSNRSKVAEAVNASSGINPRNGAGSTDVYCAKSRPKIGFNFLKLAKNIHQLPFLHKTSIRAQLSVKVGGGCPAIDQKVGARDERPGFAQQ